MSFENLTKGQRMTIAYMRLVNLAFRPELSERQAEGLRETLKRNASYNPFHRPEEVTPDER